MRKFKNQSFGTNDTDTYSEMLIETNGTLIIVRYYYETGKCEVLDVED